MNILKPPAGAPDEDRPLVHIEIERLTGAAIEHPQNVRRGGESGFVYFNRDVACPNGDVLSAKVEWVSGLDPDSTDHRSEAGP